MLSCCKALSTNCIRDWTGVINGEKDKAGKAVERKVDKYKAEVVTKVDEENVTNKNSKSIFGWLIRILVVSLEVARKMKSRLKFSELKVYHYKYKL